MAVHKVSRKLTIQHLLLVFFVLNAAATSDDSSEDSDYDSSEGSDCVKDSGERCTVYCDTYGTSCETSAWDIVGGETEFKCLCQGDKCWNGSECKDAPLDPKLMILAVSILSFLLVLGLVIGYYDQKWAPEGEKLPPRFQGPDGVLDACAALTIGLCIKFFFTVFIIGPVIAIITDEIVSFMFHLFLLGMSGMVLITVYGPICWLLGWSKKAPTFKETMKQFRVTQMEMLKSKMQYMMDNWRLIIKSLLSAFLLPFQPLRFCVFGKALTIAVFVMILSSMGLWCLVLFRIALSAFTYKLFTLKGWVQEIKDVLTIKKRVLTMDYPWVQEKHGSGPNEGKVKEAGQMATMEAGGQAGAVAATVANQGLTVAGFVFTFMFPMICEFCLDFFGGIFFQLTVVAVAIIIADAAINTGAPANAGAPAN